MLDFIDINWFHIQKCTIYQLVLESYCRSHKTQINLKRRSAFIWPCETSLLITNLYSIEIPAYQRMALILLHIWWILMFTTYMHILDARLWLYSAMQTWCHAILSALSPAKRQEKKTLNTWWSKPNIGDKINKKDPLFGEMKGRKLYLSN